LNSSGIILINDNGHILDYLSFTGNKKIITPKTISLFSINKAKDNYFKKIEFVVDNILKFINKHLPDYIFIEGFSFGSNSRSVTSLAELQGSIKYNLNKLNISWKSFPPSTVKKFITGNGHAQKEDVKEACIKINEESKILHNFDLFDAYACSLLGLFDIVYGHQIYEDFFKKISDNDN